MDLYKRVKVGTRVVVLPGRPPMTAATTPVGSRRGMSEVTPYGLPSASDMPRKRYKPEETTAKLQRQERGALRRDEVKNPKEPAHEAPKGSTQGEVSAVRDNTHQVEFKAESVGFEE